MSHEISIHISVKDKCYEYCRMLEHEDGWVPSCSLVEVNRRRMGLTALPISFNSKNKFIFVVDEILAQFLAYNSTLIMYIIKFWHIL